MYKIKKHKNFLRTREKILSELWSSIQANQALNIYFEKIFITRKLKEFMTLILIIFITMSEFIKKT